MLEGGGKKHETVAFSDHLFHDYFVQARGMGPLHHPPTGWCYNLWAEWQRNAVALMNLSDRFQDVSVWLLYS